MKRFTANYAWTNPNFVIQNIVDATSQPPIFPLLCVVRNILQRGFPTSMSKFLQGEIGQIHKMPNFNERLLFASCRSPKWESTIKGDSLRNYYPAKDFFERIIPDYFEEYAFVQSLLIPEIGINELVGEYNPNFINQQVDFYLPQARLVIEIDGQQHKSDDVTRVSDQLRDGYLRGKGIATIRISTRDLRQNTFSIPIGEILTHLQAKENRLRPFREACDKHRRQVLTREEYQTKLLPTAIIRFQLLLLELLDNNYLDFEHVWDFNILIAEDHIENFASLAIRDLQIWLRQLWRLKYKSELALPDFELNLVTEKERFKFTAEAINIDFSLFDKYTDEHLLNPEIIFVRTDYFDFVKERNYFKVSTDEPINYQVKEEDKDTLAFFLENIFDKQGFLDGQFPIIQNALNLRDTIGLLPTGGGKSICYQLPCLLQPAVNFVVCPIKSLMFDQKDNLERALITNVAHITGDMDPQVRRATELDFETGRYLFVWISPEKMQIPSFREKIISLNAAFCIAYAVVDEVHCLSEWGHDFRTSYLNLARTVDKLSPKDANGEGTIKFIGLTATASVNVLKDIRLEFSRQKQQLANENIKSLLDYSRKELIFEVIRDEGNKSARLASLLRGLADTEDLAESDEKAAIVFTPHVNGPYGCYSVSNHLNTLYPKKSNWYAGDIPKIDEYNAQGHRTGRKIPVMTSEEFKSHKDSVQKDFKKDVFPFMVATKAFGMGIDKLNIFYTFHYGLPGSVEALYQEAGRAGRWNKAKGANASLTGKCHVLYSPETHDSERVRRLFDRETKFAEMKTINEEAGFGGKDVFRQVFLFIQGQRDVAEDFELTLRVLRQYHVPGTQKKIFWDDAYRTVGIGHEELEKSIYRLSLLGIADDWTTDFVNHFEVSFNRYDDRTVCQNVARYINKYEPDRDVTGEIALVPYDSVLEKSLWFLLSWIFDNIAHNRKQSLKTLMNWCDDFRDNEYFKRRIDNYFKFTEVTFVLQHISENPLDYEQWFAALTITERDGLNAVINIIFLPAIKDGSLRKENFESLRDGISRFLESNDNNTGLNFLSGLVRLFLGEFQDSDGIGRFESALEAITIKFDQLQQEEIMGRLLEIGLELPDPAKVDLCKSLCKFYPQKLEYVAEYYNLDFLLNERYEQILTKIKNLNNQLHEQLSEI